MKKYLLFVVAFISFSCNKPTTKTPAGKTVDCTQLHILNGPVVLAGQAGSRILRWESSTAMKASGCLKVTAPDGSETSPDVLLNTVVVKNDNLFNPGDIPTPFNRYLQEVSIPTSIDGTWRWSLSTQEGARDGSFVQNSGDSTVIALIGDANTDAKDKNGVAITAKMLTQINAAKPDLLVHAGDIVYNVYGDTWPHFFATFTTTFSHMVLLPAIGNHEYEFPGEIDQFTLPYIGGNSYAADGGRVQVVDVGPMRIISLDSNAYYPDTNGGAFSKAQIDAMWRKVEAALASAGGRLKTLVFHHPIYTLSTHPVTQELRDKVLALDDKYDINFVLTGHNHVYERFAIPGRFHTLLSGGGGALLYRLEETVDDADSRNYLKFENRSYHWVKLEVTKTGVKATAIQMDGTILESVDLDIR